MSELQRYAPTYDQEYGAHMMPTSSVKYGVCYSVEDIDKYLHRLLGYLRFSYDTIKHQACTIDAVALMEGEDVVSTSKQWERMNELRRIIDELENKVGSHE